MATDSESDDDRPRPQRRWNLTSPSLARQDTLFISVAERMRLAAIAYSKLYCYEPLQDGHARLLILKQRQDKYEEIVFDMLQVPFAALGSKPYKYEALSYHWGPGDATKTIRFNNEDIQLRLADIKVTNLAQAAALAKTYLNQRVRVKPDLYAALYHLRSWKHDIKIWVDAICIHQVDREEKEKQVARMSEIYSKAKRVLIWLGPSDDQTRRAMRFLNTELTNLDRINDLVASDISLQAWRDLIHLMRREWFSRRWVIQELAFAQDATVHCGSDEIHWRFFRDGISIFSDQYDKIRKGSELSADLYQDYVARGAVEALPAQKLVDSINIVFDIQEMRGGRMPQPVHGLEYLVSALSTYETSDPRDTINAFRNIAKETYISATPSTIAGTSLEAPPEPDYSKDLLHVYTSFIKWIYRNTGCVDILCRRWAIAERKSQPRDYPRLSVLPSWIQTVDDADRSVRASGRRRHEDCFVGMPGHALYNASGDHKANAHFGREAYGEESSEGEQIEGYYVSLRHSMRESAIHLEGIRIGRVRWSTDPTTDGIIPATAIQKLLGLHEMWEDIDSAPDKLWRILVAGRGSKGERAPRLYQTACTYVLNKVMVNGYINTKAQLRGDPPYMVKAYLERVQEVIWDRCFFETELEGPQLGTGSKLHGLADKKARRGDVLCVLFGCTVPVLLREYQDLLGKTSFKLVGETYVYGLMDGEAILARSKEDLDKDKMFFRIT
ncbi:hypothetical protein LTR95_002779 [Oleoguttula sp. CCFEE 5521]